MLITLAEAFMAQANYDDALDTLAKAELFEGSYNQDLEDEEKGEVRNVKILVLKAQSLCRQKNFTDALEVIEDVIN